MKRIAATQGFEIVCDDDDFAYLSQFRWHARNDGRGNFRRRPGRSIRLSAGKRGVEFVHHALLGRPAEGLVIDHINGDPWDNRRSNLRICTVAENVRNRRNTQSAAKGVRQTKTGRWTANIHLDGARYYLGTYDSQVAAALAYDSAALFLHGEFAAPNYPHAPTLPRDPKCGVVGQGRPAVFAKRPAGPWNKNKTHCSSGHEFTPENTYRKPDGMRDCRACIRARSMRYRRAQQALAA